MNPKDFDEYSSKIDALLERGVRKGDEILVTPEHDCVPFTHFNNKKAYKIVFDCLIIDGVEPRFIVVDEPRAVGLIAYCHFPLKAGSKVKVTDMHEKSCCIYPLVDEEAA